MGLAATRGAQQPWHLKESWLREHNMCVVPCPNPVEASIVDGFIEACDESGYRAAHSICHDLPLNESPVYCLQLQRSTFAEFFHDNLFCEQLLIVERGAALFLLGKDEHCLIAGPRAFVERSVGGDVSAYYDSFVEEYAKSFPSEVSRRYLCDLAAEYRRIAGV